MDAYRRYYLLRSLSGVRLSVLYSTFPLRGFCVIIGPMLDPLELIWDNLLSRQADFIRPAFASLSEQDQQTVLAHLQRMVTEPGWQPEQRISAKAALDVLTGEVQS
jgi:hypothetical protein